MVQCRPVSREMFQDPIVVRLEPPLDFHQARKVAVEKALARSSDPMLLAWYDRKAGTFFPRVECCGEEKPAWLVYAESRGANIVVTINHEEYVFAFMDLDKFME